MKCDLEYDGRLCVPPADEAQQQVFDLRGTADIGPAEFCDERVWERNAQSETEERPTEMIQVLDLRELELFSVPENTCNRLLPLVFGRRPLPVWQRFGKPTTYIPAKLIQDSRAHRGDLCV